ncbi:MAG: beta-lactamase family protein [Hyphomicrobiales bacterium]|nr:beta-lactamase family protein [Hyphomicrobiales bacterium]MCP5370714.1 beta-lactamase family protein [Hyphomicrobiales bacterium]
MASQPFAALDSLLSAYVDSGRLAGVLAAVTDAGGPRHRVLRGLRDRDGGVPLSWDTLFRVYSMTKPVTSVAAMALWEEGRFALDDPVAAYLPAFAATRILDPDGATRAAAGPMTVRHLLSHTAGLTLPAFADDHLAPLYREHGLDGMNSRGSLTQVVDRLGALPVLFEPGTRWAYSMATDVVGRLVEVWSGQPFDAFLRDRILDPLGMADTGFQVPAAQAPRLAVNYQVADGPAGPRLGPVLDGGGTSTFLRPPQFPSGAGGLVSSADDFLRFMAMLLNGGTLDGARILKPETLALMSRNHLDGDMAALGAEGFNGASWKGIGFGLGFSVVVDPARAGFPAASGGEFGWTGAAGTAFFVNPALGIGALLLTQYMPSRSYHLRSEFRDAVYAGLEG